jgi:hypothetical protein
VHETDDNFIEHSWGLAEETDLGSGIDEDNIKMNIKGLG